MVKVLVAEFLGSERFIFCAGLLTVFEMASAEGAVYLYYIKVIL